MIKNAAKVVLMVTAFALTACYDPIYYTIARESAPTAARFPGVPPNMVVFSGGVYAASGSLQRYTSAGWQGVSKPSGKIVQLAATNAALYTLVFGGSNIDSLNVHKTTSATGAGWAKLEKNQGQSGLFTSYPYIDSMYGDENAVFIGLKNADYNDDDTDDTAYALGYEKGDGVIRILMTGCKPITGAVWVDNTAAGQPFGYHVISTLGDGFYIITQDALDNNTLMGPINSSDMNSVDSFQYGAIGPANPSNDWGGVDSPGGIGGEGKIFRPVRLQPADIRGANIHGMVKLKANKLIAGVKKDVDTVIALRTNGEILAFDETMRLFRWAAWSESSVIGRPGLWQPVDDQNAAGRPDWQPTFTSDDDFKRYKNRKVLVIGLYSGYREIVIDADGTPRTDSGGGVIFTAPGTNDIRVSTMITSNDAYQQYENSLGKHAIRGFFQVPQAIDVKMTFFANTYDEGLWSYKRRDTTDGTEWTWNHEE